MALSRSSALTAGDGSSLLAVEVLPLGRRRSNSGALGWLLVLRRG